MLSMGEIQKFQKVLEILSEENQKDIQTGPDVTNRLRDEKGRFLPNELQSETKEEYHLRSIRLVKVKGTYGTYLVKDWESVERALGAIGLIGLVAVIAMII